MTANAPTWSRVPILLVCSHQHIYLKHYFFFSSFITISLNLISISLFNRLFPFLLISHLPIIEIPYGWRLGLHGSTLLLVPSIRGRVPPPSTWRGSLIFVRLIIFGPPLMGKIMCPLSIINHGSNCLLQWPRHFITPCSWLTQWETGILSKSHFAGSEECYPTVF